MSVDTTSSIRITRLIHADAQAVWDAWTKPEHMKKWACPAPGGVQDVTSDFRVGGSYELKMRVQDEEFTAFGTYKEIDAPRRLVYTWDWREASHAVGETLITVELAKKGDATELVLVHEGFPSVEAKNSHDEGWGACVMHFEALFA